MIQVRRGAAASGRFLLDKNFDLPLGERLRLVKRFIDISVHVKSPHTQEEILGFTKEILALPKSDTGVVVEAGCFKGSSTAKFSLAAKFTDKKLMVFDSFRGIPPNDEKHEKNIFGGSAGFREGDYCGTLDEVKQTVQQYGAIDHCVFVEGYFESTMPGFSQPVSAAYIDVDLVSSTRTCIRYLYPLLKEGGAIYSQDGHLPLVIELLDDDEFWAKEIGIPKPRIVGLREKKLIKIEKGLSTHTVQDCAYHGSGLRCPE